MFSKSSLRISIVLCAFAAIGCSETPPSNDAGTDASSPDAGTRDAGDRIDLGGLDAGPGADAGTDPDAGADPDAGTGADAGTDPDAGAATDLGGASCRVPADCQDGLYCNGFEGCAPGTPGADARGCVAGAPPCTGVCDEVAGRCEPMMCDFCLSASDCSDGIACNGAERCSAGFCMGGFALPCATPRDCMEPAGTCACTGPISCNDGLFCNGVERCTTGACAPGIAPCPGARGCDEVRGACRCTTSTECDDGNFCNGAEQCTAGVCGVGARPCGARACNEATDVCGCTSSTDCLDTLYCNGVEFCSTVTNECAKVVITCPAGQTCLEGTNRCGTCVSNANCDDGVACNGAETCLATGVCMRPSVCPVDADGDGHRSIATGGDDCDDTDGLRFPGRTEVCDAADRDEDCNVLTYGVRDTDADGYGDAGCCNFDGATGRANCGPDCDDTRRGVNPIAVEVCNGLDDNCDTGVDDTVSVASYRDRDGDGSGDLSCPARQCPGTPGWATIANDCDDTRAAIRAGTSSCNPSGAGVRTCTGGVWVPAACPAGTSCRPQPDGTGICL